MEEITQRKLLDWPFPLDNGIVTFFLSITQGKSRIIPPPTPPLSVQSSEKGEHLFNELKCLEGKAVRIQSSGPKLKIRGLGKRKAIWWQVRLSISVPCCEATGWAGSGPREPASAWWYQEEGDIVLGTQSSEVTLSGTWPHVTVLKQSSFLRKQLSRVAVLRPCD